VGLYPAANAWDQLKPAGILPPGRFGHALVYDPADRKVILFGGVTVTQLANDLWAYSYQANTWTRLAPAGPQPPPCAYPSMVYDPAAGQAILFGGWTGTNTFGDTWIYEPSASKWSKLSTTGSPHPRWGASMVYDSGHPLRRVRRPRRAARRHLGVQPWHKHMGPAPARRTQPVTT
jgi:N-acetylneuraminic acid mutarotase